MKLIDYIFGSRRGREANRLERETMRDPFLADAIEGYDAVYGNHSDKLAALSQRIDARAARQHKESGSRNRLWFGLGGVAAVLLVGVAGTVWWMERSSGRRTAEPIGEPLAMAEELPAEEVSAVALRKGAAPAEEEPAPRLARMEPEEAAAESSLRSESAAAETAAAVETETQSVPAAEAEEASEPEPIESELLEAAAEADAVAPDPAAETAVATRTVSMQAREIEMEEAAVAGGLRMVHNPEFDAFFVANHKERLSSGEPVEIVVEFRVNDHGVPSAIRILSWYSQETSSEVIMLLVTGPRWEPTGDERIRTVVRYE